MKIVYYGPALSGKTTNLQQIHTRINPGRRGELVSLKTREDRTIYFDFLQLELGTIQGLKPRFSIYTVPGQVYYAATRKLVLQGADGMVFVADSHARRLKINLATLREMQGYLSEAGCDPDTLPVVVQFNKRDIPEAVPLPALRKYMGLNGTTPCFPAVAINGEGVVSTLKAVLHGVVKYVQQEMGAG